MRSDLAWALRSLGPAAELVRVKLVQNNGHVVLHAIEVMNRGVRRKLVLRRYIDLEWLQLEPDLAEREARVLQLLEHADGIRAPRLVAVDPYGEQLGWPTILMTRLPGREQWVPPSIERFAAVAPQIHALPAAPGFRSYRPYYDFSTMKPPDWSSQPKLWERAYAVAEGAKVDLAASCFIQRDHHAGNVLWSYGRVSGVVDWVEACLGPPAVDFAHARVNLVAQIGMSAVRRYARCPDVTIDPLWDVVDACDCGSDGLPGPNARAGLESFVAEALAELG